MPRTVSTVLTPLIVRSLVSSNPCFSPAHSWYFVKVLVVCNVRFSSRPCPLFVWEAVRGGDDAGKSSGGKSGRERPCLRVVTQAGAYIHRQAWLVVLDEEDVVAAAFDDLRADITLTEHGIADKDVARDG